MQVADDLAVARLGRLVTERQRPQPNLWRKTPADVPCWLRIVVAGDPDPVAAALQRLQQFAIGGGEPLRSAAVMEAVTKRHHDAGRVAGEENGESRQRHGRV